MPLEGGFSGTPSASLQGAEAGLRAKQEEAKQELALMLEKIDSVAQWGYLSPYAEEFYPEVKGMTYEQRKQKVLNETIPNITSKKMIDITREGGYKLLELAFGLSGREMASLFGRGSEKIELPDWKKDWNTLLDNVRGMSSNYMLKKDVPLNDMQDMVNYLAYQRASNLPNTDKEMREYANGLILMAAKKRKWFNNMVAKGYSPNFDKKFFDKETILKKLWYEGKIDEDTFKNNMVLLQTAKDTINGLINRDIFGRYGNIFSNDQFLRKPPDSNEEDILRGIYFLNTGENPDNKNQSKIFQAGQGIIEGTAKVSEGIKNTAKYNLRNIINSVNQYKPTQIPEEIPKQIKKQMSIGGAGFYPTPPYLRGSLYDKALE